MQLWLGLSYLDYGAPCLFLACFFVSFCLSVGFFWPGRTGTGLGPDWDRTGTGVGCASSSTSSPNLCGVGWI